MFVAFTVSPHFRRYFNVSTVQNKNICNIGSSSYSVFSFVVQLLLSERFCWLRSVDIDP